MSLTDCHLICRIAFLLEPNRLSHYLENSCFIGAEQIAPYLENSCFIGAWQIAPYLENSCFIRAWQVVSLSDNRIAVLSIRAPTDNFSPLPIKLLFNTSPQLEDWPLTWRPAVLYEPQQASPGKYLIAMWPEQTLQEGDWGVTPQEETL